MKKEPIVHLNETPKSFHELNVILRINQSLVSTLDYEKVLQIISNGMSELLEIESAAIYLLQGTNELFLGATTPALDPQMPIQLRKAQINDHPHIEKAVSTKLPQLISDTASCALSASEKFIVDIRNLKSLLYLPFIQENEVLGVLILGTCNIQRNFSVHEVEFSQTIANQLAVAIQNVRLHDDLKIYKNNLEQLVQEKTKDLDAAIEELKSTNEELNQKNENIHNQNIQLEQTLKNLKEAQAQLIQTEKLASLGVLTAGVAHEINNPLNFIAGAYFGLKTYFNDHPCDDKEQIYIILQGLKSGVDNASKIVQALNQFSRESIYSNEPCELNVITENCLTMLKYKLGERIRVTKQFAESKIVVLGNAGKIHQVILNILTNAIQAIEHEGEITIRLFRQNEKNVIEIEDNGMGIPPEHLPKITDPFFTTREPGKGIGLGLSISYNIVKEHKGNLVISSVVGKGTRVAIVLPS